MASIRVRMPRTTYGSGRHLWEQFRKGMAPILANLDQVISSIEEDVLPQAIEEAVKPTLELSQTYVPKDTGRLHDSGYVAVNKRRGQVSVEVGYNRTGEAPYAIFVHEMPQFYHEPPTQYKYLERAMDEDTDNILGRIAAQLRV